MHRTFSYSGGPESAAAAIGAQAGGALSGEHAIGQAVADYVAAQVEGFHGTVSVSGSISITVSKYPAAQELTTDVVDGG